MPRCRSGKISHMIACDSGMSGPPPMPCSMRAIRSAVMFGASPQSTDAAVNITVQIEEEALAAEHARQPAGGGQDHRVGGEVGGEHPRHLVDAGGQRALDVRQRHVGDGDVEHLHHRHEHHRGGDRPLPNGAELELGGRRGFGDGHAGAPYPGAAAVPWRSPRAPSPRCARSLTSGTSSQRERGEGGGDQDERREAEPVVEVAARPLRALHARGCRPTSAARRTWPRRAAGRPWPRARGTRAG